MSKICLVAPLPPPYGGARVSFKEFLDYIDKNNSFDQYELLDLPRRKRRASTRPGPVDHVSTIFSILCGIPALLGSRAIVVFCSRNFGFSYGLFLVSFARIFRKKIYIRFFGGHPALALRKMIWPLNRIAGVFLKGFNKIIVETDAAISEFPESLVGKLTMIPAYRTDKSKKIKLSTQNDSTSFCYIGQISQKKGISDLLEAFNKLKKEDQNISLHLYGVNVDIVESYLHQPHVEYHGHIEHARVIGELSKHDIFVFPSKHASEGHPGVLIEAFMAGLPVIASNLIGVAEIIQNEINGLLFPPGDQQVLYEKMLELAKNTGKRRKIAAASRASFAKFDSKNVIPNFINVIKS